LSKHAGVIRKPPSTKANDDTCKPGLSGPKPKLVKQEQPIAYIVVQLTDADQLSA